MESVSQRPPKTGLRFIAEAPAAGLTQVSRRFRILSTPTSAYAQKSLLDRIRSSLGNKIVAHSRSYPAAQAKLADAAPRFAHLEVGVARTSDRKDAAVFYHLPKTAGASLSVEMRDAHGFHLLTWRDYVRLDNVEPTLLAISEGRKVLFDGHTSFGLHACYGLPELTYYTIVREPIDRLISDFFYTHAHPIDGLFIPEDWRVDAFCAFVMNAPHCNYYTFCFGDFCYDAYLGPEEQRPPSAEEALRVLEKAQNGHAFVGSRVPYGSFDPMLRLERAIRNLKRFFFFVGIFEDLAGTIAHLSRTFDINMTGQLRHHVTPSRPQLSDLPSKTQALLREKTAADAIFYDAARRHYASYA